MGWGIQFNTDVFINKCSFSSMWQLDEEIKEMEDDIKRCSDRMLVLASSTPKDIVEEDMDVITFIVNEVGDLLEALDEAYHKKLLLMMFKEHLIETGEEISKFNT